MDGWVRVALLMRDVVDGRERGIFYKKERTNVSSPINASKRVVAPLLP